MSLKLIKSAATGIGVGFAFGVLMVILAFAAEKNPAAMKTWNGINAPALWLADWWTHKAGQPPRGEIAWLVVPSAMVLLQWSVIGLLAGLGWGFRPPRKGAEGTLSI
jgi:hypothetical protein